MEPYIIFCYSIKNRDIGLLRDGLRKICIIFQVLSAIKPKYAWQTLYQLHIIDISAVDVVIQKMYLANAIVNFQEKAWYFYEMDLLLEYQNEAFTCFCSNWGSFLRGTDKIFGLQVLIFDTLTKVRSVINKVIVRPER